jgi:serine/threonine protein phosphatase PrpC
MDITDALEIHSQTDRGKVRSQNEDSVAFDPSSGLVVLADGMGGYRAGEVASAMAVSRVRAEVDRRLKGVNPADLDAESGDERGAVLLRESIQAANAAVFHSAESQPEYSGMGTTLVSALFYDNRVAVGHVGDSRMYRLRGGVLQGMTRDHSLLQDQIDGGIISVKDARASKNKNLLTRAIGITPLVVPEVHVHSVLTGDLYLLCSDGLNDMVEDDDILTALDALQDNVPDAARSLIKMANDKGGLDNVSVILVKVKGEYSGAQGWLARLKRWLER